MTNSRTWRGLVLLLAVLALSACAPDDVPLTLTAQAGELAVQATTVADQAVALEAARNAAEALQTTVTAWPDRAAEAMRALNTAHATTQAAAVAAAATDALATSQVVAATVQAEAVAAAEAIAATDLAIQQATLDAQGQAVATLNAGQAVIIATATQAARVFETEVGGWQLRSTLAVQNFAGLKAEMNDAINRGAERMATLQYGLASATAAVGEMATAQAELHTSLDTALDQLATAEAAWLAVRAAATEGAHNAATRMQEWRGVVTLQARAYANRLAERDAQIATLGALLVTPTVTPSPSFTPSLTATATLLPSATATPTASPIPTVTATPAPSLVPTGVPLSAFTLCWVFVEKPDGISLRERPGLEAGVQGEVAQAAALRVVAAIQAVDDQMWYAVQARTADGAWAAGWVLRSEVTALTACPAD